jgi:DNA-binding transcriptional ArsR family regulator
MTDDVRTIADVETLKALSDPLRLAILRVLMFDDTPVLAVRSVKEIATQLGEPATKLYRHIRQLEERGLIEVAETRVVSGIIEHRYRSGQRSLFLDPDLLGSDAGRSESVAAFAAGLDGYRDEYLAAVRAGSWARTDELRPLLTISAATLTAARAAELRSRLAALVEEYVDAEPSDPAADVPVRVLLAFYRTEAPE